MPVLGACALWHLQRVVSYASFRASVSLGGSALTLCPAESFGEGWGFRKEMPRPQLTKPTSPPDPSPFILHNQRVQLPCNAHGPYIHKKLQPRGTRMCTKGHLVGTQK